MRILLNEMIYDKVNWEVMLLKNVSNEYLMAYQSFSAHLAVQCHLKEIGRYQHQLESIYLYFPPSSQLWKIKVN